MNIARHHAEWLSLIETSGPFLSMPILMRAFPQGLDTYSPECSARLREAYSEWLDDGSNEAAAHRSWVMFVLSMLLEYPPEFLVEGQAMPPGLEAIESQFGETLRPDWVLKHRDSSLPPQLLISIYPPSQKLDSPVTDKIWKATPGTRMMELLHATDVSLGLISNGEEWMLVYAPRGESTGFASWYADIWMQEPITLRAFYSLLHLRRFLGVAADDTLRSLFATSSKDQHEVTDQLGYQVRKAVEVLVHAIDQIDTESGHSLLAGVPEKTLYDGALTVMMRLVFLFSAEERKLLLLGDRLYDEYYAVSTLRDILRDQADQHGEEVLERRYDAWCRLLATFRAVYAGVEHEAMRLPAYGGTLFDPDRYPFLEGRASSTHWSSTTSRALSVNNRVVLHLLEALQILRVRVPGGGPAEAQRLSFRALDIEQIGHVYEGLLDHTAKRATEIVLGIAGTRDKEAEIPLSKLEELSNRGTEALVEFLSEETGRSENTLKKLVESPVFSDENGLVIACGQDTDIVRRVSPFVDLLRKDSFEQLVVIPTGSVYVTKGTDRRNTGTHYTPRSLTEPIVRYTLEPLVYIGPAEGRLREEWKLKSAREILALKICDMTMGSGAFLVQTCRYLAERLCESWENIEKANPGKILATPEGDLSGGDPKERLIPADSAERIIIASRYVADRCLYGVDINPMAVEMAKLSLWLITLQRDRPFTFLDHALKCGDSLLGVINLEQLDNFSLRTNERQVTFATANLSHYVEEASIKRSAIENLPSNYHSQIEIKNRLHAESEAATAKVKALADCLIAFELYGFYGQAYEDQRATAADRAEVAMRKPLPEFLDYTLKQLSDRRTFHWPIEFPEVFALGGFDAFVGNPPFMGGSRISGVYGTEYRNFLVEYVSNGHRGNADLAAYFFLRAHSLLNCGQGVLGLLATSTIAQGDTREVGLEQILKGESIILRAVQSAPWPGHAALEVAHVWLRRGQWKGEIVLNGQRVQGITIFLTEVSGVIGKPFPLAENRGKSFVGTYVHGEGFVLSPEEAQELVQKSSRNRDVLFPYLNGEDINSRPDPSPSRWVINFFDWQIEQAQQYPDCFNIVKERVLPERQKNPNKQRRELWWRFTRPTEDLYSAAGKLNRYLVHPLTSKYNTFVFFGHGIITSHMTIVIAFEDWGNYSILQSALHWEWVLVYGNKLETRPQYTPSDVFETFPFPSFTDVNATEKLANSGEAFYKLRAQIALARKEGLTKTYNRFHDRLDHSEDIMRLRTLHVEMDQSVVKAYGWRDLDLAYGFHETKQGIRYTISEAARLTILDRLLALNHLRYQEEVKSGLHATKGRLGKKQSAKNTVLEDKAKYGILGLDI